MIVPFIIARIAPDTYNITLANLFGKQYDFLPKWNIKQRKTGISHGDIPVLDFSKNLVISMF